MHFANMAKDNSNIVANCPINDAFTRTLSSTAPLTLSVELIKEAVQIRNACLFSS